jgi:hypothetical protein
MRRTVDLRGLACCAVAIVLAAPLAGCSSDSSGSTSGHTGPPGGPSDGPADTHCKGVAPHPTDMAVCQMHGTGNTDYGPTMYGTSVDDDDCKYHLAWSSTDIYEDTDVTFTVKLTTKTDDKAATGSLSLIEAFLDDKHPAPNSDQMAPEDPPGTYEIGPIRFDAKGKWTVRFHFFEQCTDVSEDSPHGHAAVYVDVP